MFERFTPKTFVVLKEGYSREKFISDLVAGLIVAIVALPLSIALGIASGVKPEQGLYTAIIGGFIISFFGGSRVQIGGPTGAFVIIIYSIIQNYGYSGLVIASIMAGIFLILFGILRMGNVIKYIPYPVTIGFTTGIALLIFSSQLKDFFGLNIQNLPAEFLEKIKVIFENFHSFNPIAFFLASSTIIITVLWSKKFKKVPGTLIAIIITTSVVQFFNLPVETIGSRFGSVPSSFPSFSIPEFHLSMIRELLKPAFTIAFLAGIESLLSAVVADSMLGTKHNSNVELIGQGIANILSPLFGGIPATGAIARTATNIKSGGRTPFSGMFHAIFLLIFMMFLGKLAILIPMATLAGILAIVSYNMSEIKHFMEFRTAPKSDIFVLLITFLLTVFTDLTIAIEFGIIASALLFMKRMSDVTESRFITEEFKEKNPEYVNDEFNEIPKGVEIFEISGPLFFGASTFFQENLALIENRPKVLIILLENVPVFDATGIKTLEQTAINSKKHGTHIILVGLHHQPLAVFKKSKLHEFIGEKNLCHNVHQAIKLSRKLILEDYYFDDKKHKSISERLAIKIFNLKEKN